MGGLVGSALRGMSRGGVSCREIGVEGTQSMEVERARVEGK